MGGPPPSALEGSAPAPTPQAAPGRLGTELGGQALVRTWRIGPVLGDPGNSKIICKAASPEPGQSELFIKSR